LIGDFDETELREVQTFGDSSPVTLGLAPRSSTCLLKYSSMPSMKMASED